MHENSSSAASASDVVSEEEPSTDSELVWIFDEDKGFIIGYLRADLARYHPSLLLLAYTVMGTWGAYKRPPHEQEYIDEASHCMGLKPSREELDDLSKACDRLWDLDLNRLMPGKDYEIDCGQGEKVYQEGDMASKSFFLG
ncbi:poly(U)-specific endoribonuclease-B-like [Canna indica]|uniref:Poly(U)-specific endoribonuclease-B-like n=1 Tax=Canna indica TaxID=4628 RepID=A0AAQ3Q7R9_9LILI|nr:poly(U)-specific endoribonuclease-B-like [Canna indica]